MSIVISGDSGISPVTPSGTSALVDGMTVGRGAGEVSTNTAVGASALAANTSGANQTAVGSGVLSSTTTGTSNTAVGRTALNSNTTGSYNTAVGHSALESSGTASYNTAVGYQAMYSSTGGVNLGIGAQALYSNTTGDDNTAIGSYRPLYFNTTGSQNIAVGRAALYSNTTGTYNTAIGRDALQANTTASNNTAVGYQAGYTLATGGGNTLIGKKTGYSLTSGYNNVFIGFNDTLNRASGDEITTGNRNTIIGAFTGNQNGLDIRTANNYIVLSDGDGNPTAWSNGNGTWNLGILADTTTRDSGVLYLYGSNATTSGPALRGKANSIQYWQIGSYSTVVNGSNQYLTCQNTSGGVYLNGASATSWTAVSDETRKVIIEPITDAANKVSTLRTVIGRLKTDTEDVRRPYLIAQDVQAVLPEAVSEAEDKEGPVLGLSYTEVIPLLVAAIKELKTEFDAYKEAHP